MPISLNSRDAQQINKQLQAELAKPAEQQDATTILRLAADYYAASKGLPGLAAVSVPYGGLTTAVRALCEGQRSQPALSVLSMDPALCEAACRRVDQLRDGLAVVQGLAEPLRAALQSEATTLQTEAKDRLATVRSLTAIPAVAAALQPATDHFFGPALRGASTRAAVRRGVDRVRNDDRPEPTPEPEGDSLLPAAPLPGRRSRRRG